MDVERSSFIMLAFTATSLQGSGDGRHGVYCSEIYPLIAVCNYLNQLKAAIPTLGTALILLYAPIQDYEDILNLLTPF